MPLAPVKPSAASGRSMSHVVTSGESLDQTGSLWLGYHHSQKHGGVEEDVVLFFEKPGRAPRSQ